MRAHRCLPLAIGFLLVVVDLSAAQDANDRRRQFFEGILRSLIDSQLDRQQPPNPGRPNRLPIRDPRVAASRQALERFAGEAGRLMTALRREEQSNPGYRSLLGDVVRIKANADILLRRVPGLSLEQLSQEYQPIDRQWRVTGHRVRQIPGVGRECLGHVEKLDLYDQQICELLNLTPQFDRNALAQEVALMRAGLETLLEDLSYQLTYQSGRRALLVEGQTLLAQVDRFSRLTDRNSAHQAVVAEYQRLYERWRQLAKQVRSLDERYLTRRMQRIEASHEAIHELLWLPMPLDRDQLQAIMQTFQRDVHQICSQITLNELIDHPQPQEALASILALNSASVELTKALAAQTGLDELVWDFRVLEVEWQTARNHLASVRGPDFAQQLAAAQRAMDSLVHALGQDLSVDRDEVVELIASIHHNADLLASRAVQLVNSSNQYPSGFRSAAQKAAREFQAAAGHLHETLIHHGDDEHLRVDSLEVAKSWQRVTATFSEFAPAHRNALSQVAGALGPDIAKLQILYTY